MAALAIGLAGLLLAASQPGFMVEEEFGLRWLFNLRGARTPPAEVAVVRLDDTSLLDFRALPPDSSLWPGALSACAARYPLLRELPRTRSLDWLPRSLHACLLDELARLAVPTVAFDVGFTDNPEREAGTADLAAAIARHGGVVLLELAERRQLDEDAARSGAASALADVLVRPHPQLAAQAAGLAPFLLPLGASHVHQFWSRHDGLPGAAQLFVRALEVQAVPALEAWARAAGRELPARGLGADARRASLVSDWLADEGRLAGDGGLPARLPPADAGILRALSRSASGPSVHYLDFFGPAGTVPSVAVYDLLARRAAIDLRGRVVFVGVQELTRLGGRDHFPTVFKSDLGVDLSGVEIGATAYHNLLRDETLRPLPEPGRLALVFAIGAAMMAAACYGSVWRGLALALTLGGIYATAAYVAFAYGGLWLPVVVPLAILLPAAVLMGQLVHYMGAVRLFSTYVPRSVTKHVLRGNLSEQPRRHQVTIMFTDVVGFSAIAEQHQPDAVAAFLNRHYTLVVAEIERQRGTVAQFIGDSVLAYWGAPDPMPDHAERAAAAALGIERALEDENACRVARGEAQVRVRIGINTGMISAGTVGGAGRATYAAVGDAVNAAQRIEQLGKVLCPDQPTVAILLGEATAERLGAAFLVEPVGRQPLRGRVRAEAVFRLRGPRPPAELRRRTPHLTHAE